MTAPSTVAGGAAGDWIAHDGGPCPVDHNVRVFVRYEDGNTDDKNGAPPAPAGYWADDDAEACNWRARDGQCGIIAYRVVQP